MSDDDFEVNEKGTLERLKRLEEALLLIVDDADMRDPYEVAEVERIAKEALNG